MSKLKNSVFSIIIIWILTPASTFAFHGSKIASDINKSDSVGEIFRYIILNDWINGYIFHFTSILAVPAIIIGFIAGYFFHRKYICYLFFLIFTIIFFIPIIFIGGKKLEDILFGNFISFYIAVFLTIIAFISSTLMILVKEKTKFFKQRLHSNSNNNCNYINTHVLTHQIRTSGM